MKWWCISFLKFRTPDPDLPDAPPLTQRVPAALVTRWWTCGCRSEARRVAGPPRPPRPHCRCPRGWAAVWRGPHSSAGCPGEWGPWLPLLRLKTGKTYHPPHSDWRCGSHQKWADWPSPSVLLGSKSVRWGMMSIRSNTHTLFNPACRTHVELVRGKQRRTDMTCRNCWTQCGTISGSLWYSNSITGTNKMTRLTNLTCRQQFNQKPKGNNVIRYELCPSSI